MQELTNFDKWHNERAVDISLDTEYHAFVVETLSTIDLRGKKILEIGCGRGGFACWFAQKYAGVYDEFFAADFSEAAVSKGRDYAESRDITSIKWSVDDIMSIKQPSEYFDIVISCETIEHVTNPKRAVKELYRVTKKGGTLILTTPNYFNFFGLYRIYLRLTGRKWSEVGQPVNKFVMIPRTLMWLRSSGYKLLSFSSNKIIYPSPLTKKETRLNWKRPNFLVSLLGINSFFIAQK